MDPSTQNFFYSLFLTLHNLTRWLIIIFAGLALLRAYRGWFQKLEWKKQDDRAGMLFNSMLDLQMLLGLALYFLFSSTTPLVVANFGDAMKNPYVRFFGFEHVVVMVVAVILAHVVRVISRKAKDAVAKHRSAALGFTLVTLAILLAIPWPFLNVARPWFRLFGLTF